MTSELVDTGWEVTLHDADGGQVGRGTALVRPSQTLPGIDWQATVWNVTGTVAGCVLSWRGATVAEVPGIEDVLSDHTVGEPVTITGSLSVDAAT